MKQSYDILMFLKRGIQLNIWIFMVYQFGIMSVDNSLNNELFNKLKDAILPPINDISNNSMAEKQKIYNDHIQYDIDKILSCDNEQIKNYCR